MVHGTSGLICKVYLRHLKAFYAVFGVIRLSLKRKDEFKFLMAPFFIRQFRPGRKGSTPI